MTSFTYKYLLKALSPNTVMLRVRASTYKFGDNTIQSITRAKNRTEEIIKQVQETN